MMGVAVLFLVIVLLLILKQALSRKPNLPPSPSRLPLIGNLHQMLSSLPHRSLHQLSQKHGQLMLLHLGSVPTLVVSSAEMAREVMKTHDLAFANRPSLFVPNHILYNSQDMVFAPYGEYWRQVKKLCTLHLLSARKVQSYHLVREQEVASMVEKISNWYGAPVNLSQILNSFSNEVISRVALGKKYFVQEGESNNEFCDLVQQISELFGEFNLEDYFPHLSWLNVVSGIPARTKQYFRKLDNFLDKVIQDHVMLNAKHDDFVNILLSLQKDHNMKISLTKDNIKAIILDMFSAGTDTSYITLEWAMSELIRNPNVLKITQDEIRNVATSNSKVSEVETSQMKYLDAVIKETLRLHPPAPLLVARESITETQLLGYKIPSQTRVVINAWAIGREQRYWEEPEEFRPERFVDSAVDYRGHDFQYIPFGSGRRACPGINFAISTIKVALANLLHLFEWEMPGGMASKDLDMIEDQGITMRRKKPLVVIAKSHFVSVA